MSAQPGAVTDSSTRPGTKETAASPFATTSPPPLTLSPSQDDAATHELVPLTSPWSRPPSCTWTFAVDGDTYQPVSGQVAVLDLHPVSSNNTISCYPAGMFDGHRTGIFSPAICPHGWTTALGRVNTGTDETLVTTTAICCSSSYTLDGSLCKLSLPTIVAKPMAYNRTASTYSDLPISRTTLLGGIAAVHTIQALFQEHDKPGLNLSDDKLVSQDDGRRRELPLNARIGIGVGAALLGILVSAAAVCYIRISHHKRVSATGCWNGNKRARDGDRWDAHQGGVRRSFGRDGGNQFVTTRSNGSVLSEYEYADEADEHRASRDSGVGGIQRSAVAAQSHKLVVEMGQNKQ